MNQELIFSDELKDPCAKKCRQRLLNLEQLEYCSSDSSFGHLYHSGFYYKLQAKCATLFDSTDDRERGHVMVRCFPWSTRKYIAINLDGVAYEAFSVTVGRKNLWSAKCFRQGELIGSIDELPREEKQSWFRRMFLSQHKFEIAVANGEYFGKFGFKYPVSGDSTVDLEIVGAPRTVPVAVSKAVCGPHRSIIGPEIDWFQLKLSKEICFVVAMWIRHQVFSADSDSGVSIE